MVNSPLNAIVIGGQVELVKAGIISYSSFTRTVEEVTVLKDVVITMGAETVVPTAPDPMAGQTVVRRFTNIWIKEKGEWILVARHANNICSPMPTSPTQAQHTDETGIGIHAIKVRWNPSHHVFFLELPVQFTGKSWVQITDANGRIVEKLEVEADTKTISIGRNYRTGIYFAQVINGHRKSTVKLVKL
ncbi:T9SS type A sorting domain-containing protein [Flavisolibacter sp. BT320]|nr:T9SS type A sorting domain-containing protein [Flavisolibacter longurius]